MKKTAICLVSVFLVLLSIDMANATPIQWQVEDGGTGHYYDFIPGGITWSQARVDAEASVFEGVAGHLATITSDAEKEFIRTGVPRTPYRAWLGGFQDTSAPDFSEPSGGWCWITDEPWDYTNWASPEPNNFRRGEDFLEIDVAASSPDRFGWGDQENYESTNSGYYIEYPVPEPSTITLAAFGALGLLAFRRCRR